MSDHVYSIATDFISLAGPEPVYPQLEDEVIAGGGDLTTLTFIDRLDDTVTIRFTATLGAGDITTLTGIVNAHVGSPTADTFEEVFAEAKGSPFKTFNFTGADLSSIQSYADAAKLRLTYTQAFTFDASGTLTQLTLTRAVDGAIFKKDFTYDSNSDLATIAVTQGP